MFPALARADEAANFGSQAPKKGPFAALCCCLETVSTDNFRMSIRPGGFVLRAPPRVLEYGRVAWPFLKAPEQHRLATPRGKRSLMLVPEPEFRQQSWMESKMNASFKWVFDGVFKYVPKPLLHPYFLNNLVVFKVLHTVLVFLCFWSLWVGILVM